MVARRRCADLGQQAPRAARVFRHDELGLAQRAPPPRGARDARVPQRRRDYPHGEPSRRSNHLWRSAWPLRRWKKKGGEGGADGLRLSSEEPHQVAPQLHLQALLELARALAADVVAIADLLQRERLVGQPALAEDRLLAALERCGERLELCRSSCWNSLCATARSGRSSSSLGRKSTCVRAPLVVAAAPARRATPRAPRAGAPSR